MGDNLALNFITEEEYNELSDSERQAVFDILNDITGTQIKDNTLYDDLYYADYDEIPVDFETFISDDRYLGKSTRNGTFLYPFWHEETKKIFSRTDINEVALSGAIGLGKSTAACLMMAYHLYRNMCLKDPQAFFRLSPGTKIVYAFLNNTLDSSSAVGFDTIQSFLKESPWFLDHGTLKGRGEQEYVPGKGFTFLVGSRVQHTLGRAICSALVDEMSFSSGQDANYTKSKIMDLYRNIKRRMESRFLVEGKFYGMMFLVSSKSSETAFLEQYIADQIKKGYPIYVVDKPVWEVKPNAYCGKTFRVAVGNKFLPSRLIKGHDEVANAECESYAKQGLRIIDVPIELMQGFEQDIDKALQDDAGISTSAKVKAFALDRIQRCTSSYLQNPFRSEVVTTGMHDSLQLRDFFDSSLIPEEVFGSPIFIHLDASVSGDRTGLSAVAIIGTKQRQIASDVTDENDEVIYSEELLCQQVFTVGIQAPSNSEISFEKTRQFIYYLRDDLGLNIKKVTTDGFQSVDVRQILLTKGFDVGYTSLDRTPDGYDSLKSGINDRRIILLQGCDELYNELTDLEKDGLTKKYDHPINGCLPEYQKVLTNHGAKRIIDLKEGFDKVYSYNIETNSFEYIDFTKLRKTRDTDELYHIITDDGKAFDCTGNHPILTTHGYVCASNLTEGDEVISVPQFPLYQGRKRGKPVKVTPENYYELLKYLYCDLHYSLSDVMEVTGFAKNCLNKWFTDWGIKRTKSEAQSVALAKYNSLLHSSKIEKEVVEYYSEQGYIVKPQYRIIGSSHPYDIYLPGLHLLIEVDGIYWHKDCKEKDDYDTLYAISAGFNIVRITDIDCYMYGINLYNEILDPNNWIKLSPSELLGNRYKESLKKYVPQVKIRKFRGKVHSTKGLVKVTNGVIDEWVLPEEVESYLEKGYLKGTHHVRALKDHPRYNHGLNLSEFIDYVGTSREHTLNELTNRFNVSVNCIKRLVREGYPDISFDYFKACYLKGFYTWKIRAITCEEIDKGIIQKVEGDVITKKEFLENYSKLLPTQFAKAIGHELNYVKKWFEYVFKECSYNEYYSFG